MKKEIFILLFFCCINAAFTQIDTVFIKDQKKKEDWKKTTMFKNVITDDNEIDLEGKSNILKMNIIAMQHQFDIALKKTWVLAYQEEKTKKINPAIESKYKNPVTIIWRNKLAQKMLGKSSKYPVFKYIDSTAKKECGGGPNCKCGVYVGKLYPIIYNVNDRNCIPMLKHILYDTSSNISNLAYSNYYSTTVHLHGANVDWQNDGYPIDSIIDMNATTDNHPKYKKTKYGLFDIGLNNNVRTYTYPNTFPEGRKTSSIGETGRHGATLWYHDHAMMRTATNVYAGLAGAYLIEGKFEKKLLNFKRGKEIPDIALMFSDKSFTDSGFLYYETTENFKGDTTGGTPEFFGNTIVVNGKIWPKLNVGKGLYRFRLLNSSSSRFYNFGLAYQDTITKELKLLDNKTADSIFMQIGTESGFQAKGYIGRYIDNNGQDPTTKITLSPGERADVLINFSNVPNSLNNVVLVNYAIANPFGIDAESVVAFNDLKDTNDSTNTNWVMKFNIDESKKNIGSKYYVSNVSNIDLYNRIKGFATNDSFKQITNGLYSLEEQKNNNFKTTSDNSFLLTLREARKYEELPTSYRNYLKKKDVDTSMISYPMVLMNEGDWNSEAYTGIENNNEPLKIKTVKHQQKEIWAIRNETNDTHPIHLHLNRFNITKRTNLDGSSIINGNDSTGVDACENGWKDVVRAKTGTVTYIEVTYLLSNPKDQKDEGQFLYHCHILEHEDMSMMRRLIIKKK